MKPVSRPVANVLVATAHGNMIVNRHDHFSRNGGSFGSAHQLFTTSQYDPDEIGLALTLLGIRRAVHGDGVVALDCGANIGMHTLEWSRAMYGWGRVLAFEAQERLFYSLAGNIALNNCFNARALWAAVGASAGTIRVPQPDYFTPSSFGSLELRQDARNEFIGQEVDYSDAATLETRMLALDDLALPRVDFVKIDIEGMELEALEGARDTIARCKPVMLIERIKTDQARLRDFLASRGYALHVLGLNVVALHADDPARERIRFT